MAKYSKDQILVLIALLFANVLCALCYSLQAPFFPAEAESKGATPSQYGLVFGIFEIVMLVMSPVWGAHISEIGPKFMATAGLFLTGGSSLLFGQLDKFMDTNTFIGFAFAIRIIESLGNGAYVISFFSFIATTFQESSGQIFATLETFYGLGMILGPTVGGALYTVGGFSLPFDVIGCLLLLATALSYFFLPSDSTEVVTRASLTSALKIKTVLLMSFAIVICTYGLGCIAVGLEPHLRPYQLNAFQVGLVFVAYGIIYAITAPVWGRALDKILHPNISITIGATLLALSFILLGPSPFLPIKRTLWLIVFSLVIQGLGMGGVLVGTYVGAQRDAITHGMPDNLSTFGIISGLWISSLSLGAFFGPSISGFIIEAKDFSWATEVCAVANLIVIVIFVGLETHRRFKKSRSLIIMDNKNNSHYGSLETSKREDEHTPLILIK